jgi:hypothetical protein
VSFLLRYTNDNKSNNNENDNDNNSSSSSNNNDLLKMTDAVVHQGNEDRLPTQNVQEVLRRYKKQRYFTLNSKQKQFNSDTFARIQKEHVSANKIDDFFVHTGNARAAAAIQREGNGNVVVQAVAQFKDCSYFVDTGDKRVFCVHTEEAKQGFLARGFTPLQVTFFSGTPTTFPTHSAAVSPTVESTDILSKGGPAELTLPANGTLPGMWKIGEDSTTAANIVHAFEVKVYDLKAKLIYSPYKKWTKEARGERKITNASSFSKYCQCYWYLRLNDMDPAETKLNMGKMTAAATERAKAIGITQPPDWYKLASDLADAPSRGASSNTEESTPST